MRIGVARNYDAKPVYRLRLRCSTQGAPVAAGVGLYPSRELSALVGHRSAKVGFNLWNYCHKVSAWVGFLQRVARAVTSWTPKTADNLMDAREYSRLALGQGAAPVALPDGLTSRLSCRAGG